MPQANIKYCTFISFIINTFISITLRVIYIKTNFKDIWITIIMNGSSMFAIKWWGFVCSESFEKFHPPLSKHKNICISRWRLPLTAQNCRGHELWTFSPRWKTRKITHWPWHHGVDWSIWIYTITNKLQPWLTHGNIFSGPQSVWIRCTCVRCPAFPLKQAESRQF